AEPSDSVGAGTVLHAPQDLPLGQREEREHQAEHGEDGDDDQEAARQPAGRLRQERREPVAQDDRGALEEGIVRGRGCAHVAGGVGPGAAALGAAGGGGDGGGAGVGAALEAAACAFVSIAARSAESRWSTSAACVGGTWWK